METHRICKKCTMYEEETKDLAHTIRTFEIESSQLRKLNTFLKNTDEEIKKKFNNYKALYSHDNSKLLSQCILTDLMMQQEILSKAAEKKSKTSG